MKEGLRPAQADTTEDIGNAADYAVQKANKRGQNKGVHGRQGSAHLTHLPVRLALALLRDVPGQFALVCRGGQQKGSRAPAGSLTEEWSDPTAAAPPDLKTKFTVTDRLHDLKVHILKGVSIVQGNGQHEVVHFTPAFLSEDALRAFWRKVTSYQGAVTLFLRQRERRMLSMRLQAAAAVIAGAGPPSGAEEEPAEDDEEPPEVQEMMQEMGLGGMAGGGSGLDGIGRSSRYR